MLAKFNKLLFSSFYNRNKQKSNANIYSHLFDNGLTNYKKPENYEALAELYTDMLNNYQISPVKNLINNAINKASWAIVETDNNQQQIIEFLEKNLFDILDIKSQLNELTSFIYYGFCLFEKKYDNINNNTYLTRLLFREQESIYDFDFNLNTGDITELKQQLYVNGQFLKKYIKINNKTLLLFNNKLGVSLGNSILDAVIEPYKRKKFIQKYADIAIKRGGLSLAFLTVANDFETTDEATRKLQTTLNEIAQGTTAGAIFPDGVDVSFEKDNSNMKALQEAILQEDDNISKALLINFLNLGATSSGSEALAKELIKNFNDNLKGYSSYLENEINNQIIKDLVILNFGVQEKYPQISIDTSNNTNIEFAQYLKSLVDANILTVDDDLEDYVRDISKLPAKTSDEDRDNEQDIIQDDDNEELQKQLLNIQLSVKTDIDKASDDIFNALQKDLVVKGNKFVDNFIKEAKTLNEDKREQAINNTEFPSYNDTIKSIDNILNEVANKAEKQALSEVKLTKKTDNRSDYLSQSQVDQAMNTLKSAVTLNLSLSSQSKDGLEQIATQANKTVKSVAESATMQKISAILASHVTNATRNDVFTDDEIKESITAFKFVNSSPESAICKEMVGTVLSSDDDNYFRYQTPLHYNCKSTWVPILRENPNITGMPSLSQQALKSNNL